VFFQEECFVKKYKKDFHPKTDFFLFSIYFYLIMVEKVHLLFMLI